MQTHVCYDVNANTCPC